MKKVLLTMIACSLFLGACGEGAKDLYETAQFEERQFNVDHAASLYRRIVEQYPSSPYAGEAKERLKALGSR